MVISVVIPLYNKAHTIDAAIASVVAQSFPEWELVVVDDGSRDEGPDVVARWAAADGRIRLIRQPNGGVSAARNHGVRVARSERVAFLDADDVWLPGHLAQLDELASKVPDAPMWATAYRLQDDSGLDRVVRLREDGSADWYLIDDYFLESVEREFPVHSSAVMVSRAALQAVGGFPVGVASGEDVLTWARLSCLGAFPMGRSATAIYMAPPVAPDRRRAAVRRPVSPCPVLAGLDALAGRHPERARSLALFRGLWLRIRSMSHLELNERWSALVDVLAAAGCSGLRRRDVLTVLLLCMPYGLRTQALARSRGYRPARSGA